mmetsp:Transcript_107424/g.342278  ORF Transcript_107424/g.342278 Transcript_107424/m.342278 type:complete len:276 (-) Transcript_107424:229-1056(-)
MNPLAVFMSTAHGLPGLRVPVVLWTPAVPLALRSPVVVPVPLHQRARTAALPVPDADALCLARRLRSLAERAAINVLEHIYVAGALIAVVVAYPDLVRPATVQPRNRPKAPTLPITHAEARRQGDRLGNLLRPASAGIVLRSPVPAVVDGLLLRLLRPLALAGALVSEAGINGQVGVPGCARHRLAVDAVEGCCGVRVRGVLDNARLDAARALLVQEFDFFHPPRVRACPPVEQQDRVHVPLGGDARQVEVRAAPLAALPWRLLVMPAPVVLRVS